MFKNEAIFEAFDNFESLNHEFEFGNLDRSGTFILGVVNAQGMNWIGVYDILEAKFKPFYNFQFEVPLEIHVTPDSEYIYTINKNGKINWFKLTKD